MAWFAVALAGFMFCHTVSFLVCWLCVRSFRIMTVGRTIAAFFLAWLSMPLMVILLGKAPAALSGSELWAIAFIANAIFLFVLSHRKVLGPVLISKSAQSPLLTAEGAPPLNEDR